MYEMSEENIKNSEYALPILTIIMFNTWRKIILQVRLLRMLSKLSLPGLSLSAALELI
jgi:hypothetical protein